MMILVAGEGTTCAKVSLVGVASSCNVLMFIVLGLPVLTMFIFPSVVAVSDIFLPRCREARTQALQDLSGSKTRWTCSKL